jgi:hypothetical protein
LFTSVDDAAADFVKNYNPKSIKKNREYSTSIYGFSINGVSYYTYAYPKKGKIGSSPAQNSAPPNRAEVALAHTHGGYDLNYDSNIFSGKADGTVEGDLATYALLGLDGYVGTPNGSLLHYDAVTNTITTVSTNIPSDPKDPTRLNTVAPTTRGTASPRWNIFDTIVRFFKNLFHDPLKLKLKY